MTIPLWTLGGLSVAGGLLGVPNFLLATFTHEEEHINLLHNWLHNVNADAVLGLSHAAEWGLMGLSVAVALGGVWTAWRMYGAGATEESDARIATRFGALYRTWNEKYRLDEFYEGVVVNPLVRFSDRGLAAFDMKIVDGVVNTVGGIVRLFGSLIRYTQTGVVSSYALALVIGVIIVLSLLIL